ncbi:hypothetical protein ACFL5Q_04250, partial [Planctomycetota bacterium]
QDRWTRDEWARHVDQCVYCRRMMRGAYASAERRAAGLPPGEPLLRDWLLRPHYQDALKKIDEKLKLTGPIAVAAAAHADMVPRQTPLPQTDRVTVTISASRFVGVGNGHAAPVQTDRSGRCGQLSWKLLGPARRGGVMGTENRLQESTLSGMSEALEFTRDLGPALGRLKVVVRMEKGDTISCDTSLLRPENEPTPRKELALKVTYRHALAGEERGSDRTLRVIAPLAGIANVPGSALVVSVLEGVEEDAKLLGEATFQFQEGSHSPAEGADAPEESKPP